MNNVFDINKNLLDDGKRIFRLGKWLRNTSLDEIPSLVNIIKGEISFVGPRPLLQEYLTLYTIEQSKRHNTKPGLTGLAQINGRNAISWEQKFEYDLDYLKNKSFFLDLKIILLTVIKVLKKEGIHQKGKSTMEKFKGTIK